MWEGGFGEKMLEAAMVQKEGSFSLLILGESAAVMGVPEVEMQANILSLVISFLRLAIAVGGSYLPSSAMNLIFLP